MGKTVYGIIANEHLSNWTKDDLQAAASQVFSAKSGRFVAISSGRMIVATAGLDRIVGYTSYIGTTSSTAGDTSIPVNISRDVIYEVPAHIASAFTAANLRDYLFDVADIHVASNIQYVNLTDSTADDIFHIVGGNVTLQTIYVRLNETEVIGGTTYRAV